MTEFVLSNRERSEDVAFLIDRWITAEHPRAFSPLENEQSTFFDEMAYQLLATQDTPESLVKQDWEAMVTAGIPETVERGNFGIPQLNRYALDPPVTRSSSKGKLIDWIKLYCSRETWERLLPEPADPDVAVDVIFAATGGVLKARAFQVVHDMVLHGRWLDEDSLNRYGIMPTHKFRTRVTRMGLVDLPVYADTFMDYKAFSRAVHAVYRVGDAPALCGAAPILKTGIRCEICDATRMASCPMPHCKFRRASVQ